MFRLSPRRSHRSQGFKVKHALQLFLLVCVSIWLLYQVRHSREKKAEFEEAARVAKETIKLGRKDLLPRIIVPLKKDNTKITETTIDLEHDNHRLVERETDRRWDPLYAKQHMEETREDAKGKEESKDEEESKEHENAETESEENKEAEESQENSNEAKENGEENEGEESKEEAGESESDDNQGKSDAHDEAAREVHYNADDASSAVVHVELDNSDSGENKPHEFVSWSNTNSTQAYIHQEDRDRNMIETETGTDDNIDSGEGNNSTTELPTDTSHPFSTIVKDMHNDSSPQNLTSDSNSSATGQVLNSYPAAKSFGKFRSTLFRRHARTGSKKQEGVQGTSVGDDVQNLKEEVDYLSVIRKKDDTSNGNNKLKEDESSDDKTRFYNTGSSQLSQEDASNGTSDPFLDTSILQEEKDATTDLETLPTSLTAGGNMGQEAAAE